MKVKQPLYTSIIRRYIYSYSWSFYLLNTSHGLTVKYISDSDALGLKEYTFIDWDGAGIGFGTAWDCSIAIETIQ